jgi:hypothetical protein
MRPCPPRAFGEPVGTPQRKLACPFRRFRVYFGFYVVGADGDDGSKPHWSPFLGAREDDGHLDLAARAQDFQRHVVTVAADPKIDTTWAQSEFARTTSASRIVV